MGMRYEVDWDIEYNLQCTHGFKERSTLPHVRNVLEFLPELQMGADYLRLCKSGLFTFISQTSAPFTKCPFEVKKRADRTVPSLEDSKI